MRTIDKITTGPNPNNGISLYYNGKFLGMYSEHKGEATIMQATNFDSIFDGTLCVEYLKSKFPEQKIYLHVSHGNNQAFLKVSNRRILTVEGTVREF